MFEHGVSVLTGPPEAVEEVVRALAGRPGVVVTAATDRAAGDASGAAGSRSGVHRLLEPGPDGYARGVEHPIEADIVVVAEANTLDVERAAALVDACMDGTHLVLTADPAAPSPLAAGRVLGDAIACGALPVVALPASPGGAIGRVAAAAREGALVPVDPADREVVIVPAGEAREAAHRAVQLVTDSIPRALGIPAEDVLVVTPARRGEAGADALNQALKARLNPGPGPYDMRRPCGGGHGPAPGGRGRVRHRRRGEAGRGRRGGLLPRRYRVGARRVAAARLGGDRPPRAGHPVARRRRRPARRGRGRADPAAGRRRLHPGTPPPVGRARGRSRAGPRRTRARGACRAVRDSPTCSARTSPTCRARAPPSSCSAPCRVVVGRQADTSALTHL